MIKIWCENCKGRGIEIHQHITKPCNQIKCDVCNGKGYAEDEQLEKDATAYKELMAPCLS